MHGATVTVQEIKSSTFFYCLCFELCILHLDIQPESPPLTLMGKLNCIAQVIIS
jgi:hypothetical protein